MNAILQAQLDRVETALTTLVESITSYNPSITAASDLLSADDELTKGLEQLAIHQANHARILTLRSTSEALDAEIKSTLTLLADTRKELLSTPATTFPSDSRDVPYHELLAYAKRISKFTVPPTIRAPPSQGQLQSQTINAGEQTTDKEPNGVNGIAAEDAVVTVENTISPGIGVSSLAAGESQWLDPSSQIPFVPWPTQEVIRRGALAQIQVMLEQGVDPTNVPSAVGEETKQEDINEIKREKEVVESARRESTFAGTARAEVRREEKPAVFGGLDLYDPDDE
ncbi:MAG: hypothetical protein M1830_002332 [Pleopsidium flavum]|nr:MAG: hypothetical protein M1830_002332 [Pleopsidium flavum]